MSRCASRQCKMPAARSQESLRWPWVLTGALLVACGTHAAGAPNGIAARSQRASAAATKKVDTASTTAGSVELKILGFNDFHGHLSSEVSSDQRPVGGAAVLAAYLKAAMQAREGRSLIVHAGDLVSASPPESALLQDEPSIEFLNALANADCGPQSRAPSKCNIVGTLGNHEFDEGQAELLRLLHGGNHADGPFLESPYPGALFPYVNSNIVVRATGKPFIAPFVIRELGGVRVGVIGAVTKSTPTSVSPRNVAELEFRDEVASINEQARALSQQGVHAIIVAIHEGSEQVPAYAGPTDPKAVVGAVIGRIVAELDDDVDIVISGHSHSFTNAYVETAHGHEILVVQAYSGGAAYDDIDMVVDRAAGEVISKSARIVTTYADTAPGTAPDASVSAIVNAAIKSVEPKLRRPIAKLQGDITRHPNEAGESALGDLIADAERATMKVDFAFVNDGGIRADFTYAASPATPLDRDGLLVWGEVFKVLPFGDKLVRIEMTGQQVIELLDQQWAANHRLQVAGLEYTWDKGKPTGDRVLEVRVNGKPIERAKVYRVATSTFLAEGGDGFTQFGAGAHRTSGPVDIDALVQYLGSRKTPISAPQTGRIECR